jgi:hypothetical protein
MAPVHIRVFEQRESGRVSLRKFSLWFSIAYMEIMFLNFGPVGPTGQLVKSPSMRRPVGVKWVLLFFRWTKFSLSCRVVLCRHPSIRTL